MNKITLFDFTTKEKFDIEKRYIPRTGEYIMHNKIYYQIAKVSYLEDDSIYILVEAPDSKKEREIKESIEHWTKQYKKEGLSDEDAEKKAIELVNESVYS